MSVRKQLKNKQTLLQDIGRIRLKCHAHFKDSLRQFIKQQVNSGVETLEAQQLQKGKGKGTHTMNYQ